MNKNPLVSVIIPVFNAESFVYDAVTSILSQSHANIEILIIDDGSTDGSLKVLSGIKSPKIRLLSRENRGLVPTLNELLLAASGEFIARMDADDIADSYRIERQLKFINENDLDGCGSFVRQFGDVPRKILLKPIESSSLFGHSFFDVPIWHPTVMIKSVVYKRFFYDADYTHAEDTNMWVDMLLSNIKLGNIPHPLLNYRFHAGQVSSMHRSLQHKNSGRARRKLFTLLPNDLLSDLEKDTLSFSHLTEIVSPQDLLLGYKKLLGYLKINYSLPEKRVVERKLLSIVFKSKNVSASEVLVVMSAGYSITLLFYLKVYTLKSILLFFPVLRYGKNSKSQFIDTN